MDHPVDIELLSRAVRRVVGAMTSSHTADCIWYALVGAGLLRRLGVNAEAVAGSSAWRVGPGDPDTISHATEVNGEHYAPTANPGRMAGMFHTWIRVMPTGNASVYILDLTTFQLRTKACVLDASDGGRTQVDFCPDFIFVPEGEHHLGPRDVVQSFDVGVFSYLRKPSYEPIVFRQSMIDQASDFIDGAHLVYAQLCNGIDMRVVGLGEDGSAQTEDNVVPHNLKPFRP